MTIKAELITTEDLTLFKEELLIEIRSIFEAKVPSSENSRWLRSAEVRKLMKISQGTLQNHRVNGTLGYSKIGKTFYYKREDIINLLENKTLKPLVR